MKWQFVIMFVSITFSILVAPSLPLTTYHNRQAAIETFDICHSSDPALFTDGNMLALNECAFIPLRLALNAVSANNNSPIKIYFVVSQDERLPKA